MIVRIDSVPAGYYRLLTNTTKTIVRKVSKNVSCSVDFIAFTLQFANVGTRSTFQSYSTL